jgi:predicted DNA-binding protein (UPF0278 family)
MLKLLFWSNVEEIIKSKVEGKIESILEDTDLVEELSDRIGTSFVKKPNDLELDKEIMENFVKNITLHIMSGIGIDESTEEENGVLSGYWLPNNLPKK